MKKKQFWSDVYICLCLWFCGCGGVEWERSCGALAELAPCPRLVALAIYLETDYNFITLLLRQGKQPHCVTD